MATVPHQKSIRRVSLSPKRNLQDRRYQKSTCSVLPSFPSDLQLSPIPKKSQKVTPAMVSTHVRRTANVEVTRFLNSNNDGMPSQYYLLILTALNLNLAAMYHLKNKQKLEIKQELDKSLALWLTNSGKHLLPFFR